MLKKKHNIIEGNRMFDQSNWEKTSIYCQRPARWPDEKRKKHFNAEYKKNTRQHGIPVGTSCRMPLLTKKNIKAYLIMFKFIWLDLWSSGIMFYGITWPNWNFLDPWISGVSGAKRQSFWAEEHHHGQTRRCSSLVMGVLWRSSQALSGNLDCMKGIMNSKVSRCWRDWSLMINGLSCRTTIPKYTSESTEARFRDQS